MGLTAPASNSARRRSISASQESSNGRSPALVRRSGERGDKLQLLVVGQSQGSLKELLNALTHRPSLL